jgi:hypothetical protein
MMTIESANECPHCGAAVSEHRAWCLSVRRVRARRLQEAAKARDSKAPEAPKEGGS